MLALGLSKDCLVFVFLTSISIQHYMKLTEVSLGVWIKDDLVLIQGSSFVAQVWKDVDGVLTCDPRVYPNALPVPFLTFDEASELAYFGAQVL